jgi:hypothetical protein
MGAIGRPNAPIRGGKEDAWINPSTTSTSRIVDKIAAGGSNGYLLDLLGGKLRLIIDGQGLSGTIPTNTLPVRIGADSTGAANLFLGWSDEVEIFNRALSLTEIQGIYNAGSAGKCKPQRIPATSPIGLVLLGFLVVVAGLLLLRRS